MAGHWYMVFSGESPGSVGSPSRTGRMLEAHRHSREGPAGGRGNLIRPICLESSDVPHFLDKDILFFWL